MKKTTAFALLGGSASTVARALGLSLDAVHKWPAVLSPTLSDQVLACAWRSEWRKEFKQLSTTARKQVPEILRDAMEV